MYHSLTIKTFPGRGSGSLTFNTYQDFYLVPTSLPVISTPAVQTKTIDIPGANGSIDLTESLTPFPTYKNRTGSIEFAVLNDRYEQYVRYNRSIANGGHGVKKTFGRNDPNLWAVLYSDLMNKLHGRKCQIILEDDPDWYYEGRIAVSSWKPSNDGKWPTVTLNYDLYPYKLSVYDSTQLSTDDWLWNPFSFIDGVIYNGLDTSLNNSGLFKKIVVNSNDYVTYTTSKPGAGQTTNINRNLTGWMPVSPSIVVSENSNGMALKITNAELGYTYEKTYTPGAAEITYNDPECILYDYLGNGYTLQLKGHGTFTIKFRKGSL